MGSAYRRLSVICSLSEGSTRSYCPLPLKRFTEKPYKTSQRRSLCASAPTCSCHSRHTGKWAELLTHLVVKITCQGECGRRGDGETEDGNSLGRLEAMCNKAVGFHLIIFDGFRRQKCRSYSGDRLPSSISFIIHIRIPPQKDLSPSIIFLQLSLSPSATLWSLPPSGFAEAPTPETHTGFNTPVSPQSSLLFVRCVDVFMGLKLLLCSLPAVCSRTQAAMTQLTTVCGHVMQSTHRV